ncbi:MAG: terminase large subunit domain-containing protein [Candidatus Limnocylindria bacterium]
MAASEGPFVTEFIETHCRITRGRDAGQLLRVQPWQRELLEDVFELAPDGTRKHRRAYLQMPRKNGKTTLWAAASLYEAVTGEQGGEIYFVAGSRDQARRAFDEASRMVEMDPTLSGLATVYRSHIEIPSTGTILRVLSAEAGLQLGLSPSFVVFDELAVQANDKLWTAMTLGSGARSQPLIVAITTPGWQRDSLAFALYDHGKRVRSGEVDDPTFYFKAWEPSDPAADWQDPEVWRESNPALGSFLFEADFHASLQTTSESDFRRFRLGQWTATKEAALPAGAWEACAVEREVPAGTPIILACDPSFLRDATALIAATLDEVPHLFPIDVWEQPQDEPSWRIDVPDVMQAMRDAARRFDARVLAFDPPRWGGLMAGLQSEGYDALIREWPTGTPALMSPAWLNFRDAVMERRLTHNGDPRLARHVANMVIKSDRLGPRPVRDRSSPRSFIDAGIAAVVAYDVARKYEPPKPRKPRRLVTY